MYERWVAVDNVNVRCEQCENVVVSHQQSSDDNNILIFKSIHR
jgi:hypothetical protein